MNDAAPPLHRKLRIAGAFVIAGLLVEFFSLLRIHPLAFLTFMFVGGAFLIVGVVFYLYSIISAPTLREDRSS